ncbi:MAG: hypothetical protein CMH57_12565 [Myxococcales bacterium]|nr:hypothetical protein [Myxococcales bacterium]
MDPADRAYMTEILTQLKLARDQKAEAEREFALWSDRMKLAKEKGAEDLYRGARDRALRARDALTRAESTIMELEVERDSFKKEARRVGEPERVAAAQKQVESLKGTDLDPDMARLDRMSRESDADDALAALKRDMGLD